MIAKVKRLENIYFCGQFLYGIILSVLKIVFIKYPGKDSFLILNMILMIIKPICQPSFYKNRILLQLPPSQISSVRYKNREIRKKGIFHVPLPECQE